MQETPIVIHQHLIQKFMGVGKDFSNVLALYTFYIYHAQKQKTNQPLATDDFTSNGLNWGREKVKRIKRILKDLKVIEVVQKSRYSYIHLFFIYTKKTLGKLFGEENKPTQKNTPKKEEITVPKKIKAEPKKVPKTPFHLELEKHHISQDKIKLIRESILSLKDFKKYKFDIITFAKWIAYFEKNKILYTKAHLLNWIKKLNHRTTLEQKEAIYKSINNQWKDLYLPSLKASKYHKFLGQHLFIDDKNFDTLVDIDVTNNLYIYTFKNKIMKTKETPKKLFLKHGYKKEEVKKAPINSKVMRQISGLVRRF